MKFTFDLSQAQSDDFRGQEITLAGRKVTSWGEQKDEMRG
jgi:hypothetical protein